MKQEEFLTQVVKETDTVTVNALELQNLLISNIKCDKSLSDSLLCNDNLLKQVDLLKEENKYLKQKLSNSSTYVDLKG